MERTRKGTNSRWLSEIWRASSIGLMMEIQMKSLVKQVQQMSRNSEMRRQHSDSDQQQDFLRCMTQSSHKQSLFYQDVWPGESYASKSM